jgi:tripartite-type tricarboxylate transporter receptor subunit TctC
MVNSGLSGRAPAFAFAAFVSAAALLSGAAVAQDYPTRTITFIVPQAPGGNTDTLARIFAPAMAKILGKEIVVENRPGAGHAIGLQIVKESAPDGYTLGLGAQSGLTLAPLTKSDLAYDPIADFAPIYNFANTPNALVVNAELGPKTIAELVALAKEKPGELNYSSAGVGTASHLAGALFVALAGIADKVAHIPYQGGSEASVAASAGEVQFYAGPTGGSLTGLIDAGKLVALAVSGGKRLESMPDVPTFAEAGLPDYTAVGYFGLVAPAGTPQEIIDKLNAAGNEASRSPEVVAALKAQGIDPIENTPEEFAATIKADIENATKLVKDGSIVLVQ